MIRIQIKKDEVRTRILDATKRLFLERGFKKTAMKDVAKEAGLSVSNIYTYFKNKEELLLNLVNKAVNGVSEFRKINYSEEVWNDPESWNLEFEKQVYHELIELIYQYKDEFTILFLKSQGSKFGESTEVIFEKLFDDKERNSKIQKSKNNKYLIRDIPIYIQNQTAKMYMNVLLEGVEENISKEEMVKRMEETCMFLYEGYKMYFSDFIKKQ